jgi:hypothetical protein
MAGYQFAHLELWGRQPPPVKKTKTPRHGQAWSAKSNKPQQGEGRWTVADILGEAGRTAGHCPHVAEPHAEIVHGLSLAELRAEHDKRAAEATIVHGKGRRKIRIDQQTLASLVISHPTPCRELANPAKAEAVLAWEQAVIAWARRQHGEQVASVVRHWDEGHPHLHLLLLPDGPEMRARLLHPGNVAKDRVMAEERAKGTDREQINRLGDRAYRAAMRAWQDEVHAEVSAWHGHARLGPRRQRLQRPEWQAVQRQQEALAAAARMVEDRTAKDEALLREAHANLAEELARSRQEADERAKAILAEAAAAGDVIRVQAEREAAVERQRGRVQLDGLATGATLIETGAIEDIRKQEGHLRVVAAPGRRDEVAAAMPAIRPVLPALKRMLEVIRERVQALLRPERAALAAQRARLAELMSKQKTALARSTALAEELGDRKAAREATSRMLGLRTRQGLVRELGRPVDQDDEPDAAPPAPCPR